jgi:hypothetical protein
MFTPGIPLPSSAEVTFPDTVLVWAWAINTPKSKRRTAMLFIFTVKFVLFDIKLLVFLIIR